MHRRSFLKAALVALIPSFALTNENEEETKRQEMVDAMRKAMRNTAQLQPVKKFNFDDIYMSPEALEDIRAWVAHEESVADPVHLTTTPSGVFGEIKGLQSLKVDLKKAYEDGREMYIDDFEINYDPPYSVMVQPYVPRMDLGREELFELGRPGHYHRFVNFPIETETIRLIDTNASTRRNQNISA